MSDQLLEEEPSTQARKIASKYDYVFFYYYDLENSNTDEEEFCLIRYSHSGGFDIVPQRCVRTPSNTIETYGTYQVELNGNLCDGTVILKGICHTFKLDLCLKLSSGTRRDCERLQHNITSKSSSDTPVSGKNLFLNWYVLLYCFHPGADTAPESIAEPSAPNDSSASQSKMQETYIK